MARANRHHIPGQIWHITHRCHKREFLLKFSKDRSRWMQWLFEAKKRYQLQVLNFAVTSNHIHLLVADSEKDVIPKSLQLIAGKTAQEFNKRKKRKGAFWDDRYHATAIEAGEHLLRCLVYIDLNMVRNGVVAHPSLWRHGGYNEIQNPPERYSILDREILINFCGFSSDEQLRSEHKQWIEDFILSGSNDRQPDWSDSVAVGGQEFIETIKNQLNQGSFGRKTQESDDSYVLREPLVAYNCHLPPKKGLLSTENSYYLPTNKL
jgi:REP element-mobilizing transposase RayT